MILLFFEYIRANEVFFLSTEKTRCPDEATVPSLPITRFCWLDPNEDTSYHSLSTLNHSRVFAADLVKLVSGLWFHWTSYKLSSSIQVQVQVLFHWLHQTRSRTSTCSTSCSILWTAQHWKNSKPLRTENYSDYGAHLRDIDGNGLHYRIADHLLHRLQRV